MDIYYCRRSALWTIFVCLVLTVQIVFAQGPLNISSIGTGRTFGSDGICTTLNTSTSDISQFTCFAGFTFGSHDDNELHLECGESGQAFYCLPDGCQWRISFSMGDNVPLGTNVTFEFAGPGSEIHLSDPGVEAGPGIDKLVIADEDAGTQRVTFPRSVQHGDLSGKRFDIWQRGEKLVLRSISIVIPSSSSDNRVSGSFEPTVARPPPTLPTLLPTPYPTETPLDNHTWVYGVPNYVITGCCAAFVIGVCLLCIFVRIDEICAERRKLRYALEVLHARGSDVSLSDTIHKQVEIELAVMEREAEREEYALESQESYKGLTRSTPQASKAGPRSGGEASGKLLRSTKEASKVHSRSAQEFPKVHSRLVEQACRKHSRSAEVVSGKRSRSQKSSTEHSRPTHSRLTQEDFESKSPLGKEDLERSSRSYMSPGRSRHASRSDFSVISGTSRARDTETSVLHRLPGSSSRASMSQSLSVKEISGKRSRQSRHASFSARTASSGTASTRNTDISALRRLPGSRSCASESRSRLVNEVSGKRSRSHSMPGGQSRHVSRRDRSASSGTASTRDTDMSALRRLPESFDGHRASSSVSRVSSSSRRCRRCSTCTCSSSRSSLSIEESLVALSFIDIDEYQREHRRALSRSRKRSLYENEIRTPKKQARWRRRNRYDVAHPSARSRSYSRSRQRTRAHSFPRSSHKSSTPDIKHSQIAPADYLKSKRPASKEPPTLGRRDVVRPRSSSESMAPRAQSFYAKFRNFLTLTSTRTDVFDGDDPEHKHSPTNMSTSHSGKSSGSSESAKSSAMDTNHSSLESEVCCRSTSFPVCDDSTQDSQYNETGSDVECKHAPEAPPLSKAQYRSTSFREPESSQDSKFIGAGIDSECKYTTDMSDSESLLSCTSISLEHLESAPTRGLEPQSFSSRNLYRKFERSACSLPVTPFANVDSFSSN